MDQFSPKQATDPLYLRARMITLLWLGHISGNPRYINLGDLQAALKYYREYLVIAKQLAALDPKNALAQQDLAAGYQRMADVLTVEDPAQAVEYQRQALGLINKWLASAPQETLFLNWEGHSLKGMGIAQHRLGERQSALQNLRRALQVWHELRARDATNSKMQANLHTTLLALADTTLESGDHSSALAHYREALTLAEIPPVEQSADLYVRWRLADSYAGLSRYHAARALVAPTAERLSHWREAGQYAQRSLDLWEAWGKHADSTNFDRRQREQAAQTVATCNAALAKLDATPTRK